MARRSKRLEAPCGAQFSKRGKPFTEQSLTDHVRSCRDCNGDSELSESESLAADILGDDVSDGVYWGLVAELDGLF